MSRYFKKHHEPVTPYHSSTYIALCSVTQALPLGVLFFQITEKVRFQNILDKIDLARETFTYINFADAIDIPARSLLVFFLVALVWHRYALDNRVVAWSLTVLDTIIPFTFSILQCVLALTINATVTEFAMVLTLISGWGYFAYYQIQHKFNNERARSLYVEHYGRGIGVRIHSCVSKYFRTTLFFMSLLFLFLFGSYLLAFYVESRSILHPLRAYRIELIVVLTLSFPSVFYLYFDNVNKRTERLLSLEEALEQTRREKKRRARKKKEGKKRK